MSYRGFIALFFTGILFWIAIFLLALVSGPAAAQASPCAGWADLRTYLEARYGEQVTAQGLTPEGRLLVILSNPQTGSFTAVALDPSGRACGMAAGSDWSQWAVEPLPDDPT